MLLRNAAQLRHLVDLFPLRQQISYCFAYGSAIFEQSFRQVNGETKKLAENGERKMIDLVLAVDNPLRWHQANLAKNWSHYSGLRYLGPSRIAWIQQHYGAKIFYNTLIPVEKDYIKYGVIGTEDLINDLLDWDTFYVSGRLHKPTLVLHQNSSTEDNQMGQMQCRLEKALQINLQNALHMALLLLPERFNEEDLYMTIAGLSYTGDFRMTFGEDKQKVRKIVAPQIENFRQIYFPLVCSDLLKDLVNWQLESGLIEQNISTNAVQWHLNLLPKTVQYYLSKEWLSSNSAGGISLRNSVHRFDMDDLMRRVAFDIDYRSYLRRAIEAVVFQSSWSQSLKGLFTAGLSKSIIYSSEKINKMLASLKHSSANKNQV